MELEFRKVRADEIEIRKNVNNGGVQLTLYKNNTCDNDILNEALGVENWQRLHPNGEPGYCTVSIFNKKLGRWVSKGDFGTKTEKESVKGLANDAFKRACMNWGIGRELFTAPDLFIKKEYLQGYTPNDSCKDTFLVEDINYDEDGCIKLLTINASHHGKVHHVFTFDKSGCINTQWVGETSTKTLPATSVTQGQQEPVTAPKMESPRTQPASAPTQKPVIAPDALIADDEIILMGNCRGKKYGDVKDTPMFKSFLNWAKNSNSSYKDPAQVAQMEKFKAMSTMSK